MTNPSLRAASCKILDCTMVLCMKKKEKKRLKGTERYMSAAGSALQETKEHTTTSSSSAAATQVHLVDELLWRPGDSLVLRNQWFLCGYPDERTQVAIALDPTTTYTIKAVTVHKWQTDVVVEEDLLHRQWSSVFFERPSLHATLSSRKAVNDDMMMIIKGDSTIITSRRLPLCV
jgi:hypothetical protein